MQAFHPNSLIGKKRKDRSYTQKMNFKFNPNNPFLVTNLPESYEIYENNQKENDQSQSNLSEKKTEKFDIDQDNVQEIIESQINIEKMLDENEDDSFRIIATKESLNELDIHSTHPDELLEEESFARVLEEEGSRMRREEEECCNSQQYSINGMDQNNTIKEETSISVKPTSEHHHEIHWQDDIEKYS